MPGYFPLSIPPSPPSINIISEISFTIISSPQGHIIQEFVFSNLKVLLNFLVIYFIERHSSSEFILGGVVERASLRGPHLLSHLRFLLSCFSGYLIKYQIYESCRLIAAHQFRSVSFKNLFSKIEINIGEICRLFFYHIY